MLIKKIVLAYGVSASKRPDILWGAQVSGKKTIEDVNKKIKLLGVSTKLTVYKFLNLRLIGSILVFAFFIKLFTSCAK